MDYVWFACWMLALIGAFAVLQRVWKARAAKRGATEIAAAFPGEKLQQSAPVSLFFGLLSGGDTRQRPSGPIVSTDDTLWFSPNGSAGPLTIPRAAITEASIVVVYHGRIIGRALLRVDFTDPSGTADAAAWLIYGASLEDWVDTLRPAGAAVGSD